MTIQRRQPGLYGRKMGVSEIGSQFPLESYLTAPLPLFTGAQDFTSGVAQWGMLGNDTEGDCPFAGRVHYDMGNAWLAKEEPVGNIAASCWPTAAQVVAAYLKYDKGQDVGCDLGEVLVYWLTNPLANLKPIGGFAQVSVCEPQFSSALHVFGGLYTGENISQEAEDQFSAGEPWTSTATDWVGGHCTDTLALPDTSKAPDVPGFGRLITWGADQLFSWPWWQASREEAYVIFTREQMAAPDGIFNGVNVAQLKVDIRKLHGQF
jgi:hypothetical protein